MIDLDRVMTLFREIYPDPLDFIQSEDNDYWLARRVEYVDQRTDTVTGYEVIRDKYLGHNLLQIWDALWTEKSRRKWEGVALLDIPF